MPYYEWSESTSVGVQSLDDDNKRIIGIINQLHECLQRGSPADVLNEIFDSLIAYVEAHFSREEKVIEACGYPHAKIHQEEHVVFTEHLYKQREEQAALRVFSNVFFVSLLARWRASGLASASRPLADVGHTNFDISAFRVC